MELIEPTLITLLISCIVYIWYNEWQEMETLEFYNP